MVNNQCVYGVQKMKTRSLKQQRTTVLRCIRQNGVKLQIGTPFHRLRTSSLRIITTEKTLQEAYLAPLICTTGNTSI
jgi:hypothetical protein